MERGARALATAAGATDCAECPFPSGDPVKRKAKRGVARPRPTQQVIAEGECWPVTVGDRRYTVGVFGDRLTPEELQVLTCPRCQNTAWHNYRLIPQAPAAGCGRCGLVVLLTAPCR